MEKNRMFARVRHYVYVLIAFFLMGAGWLSLSCVNSRTNEASAGGDTLRMAYAKNIEIIEYEDHTDVTMRNPWDTTRILAHYILTADSMVKGADVVHVPLKCAAVFTSVHCALFQELGVKDAVRGVCDLQYMPIAYVHDGVADGHICDLGNSMEPNVERLIDLMPDAVLRSPFEQSGGYGKIGRLNIPVIECADYMEVGPLARAEWIRFYGRLVGKAACADSIFKTVEQRYLSLKSLSDKNSSKPKLVCEAPYNGQWYLPAGRSTMGQMYADAGADYLFSDIKGTGSSAMSIEHVLERALTADVWLVKTYGLKNREQLIRDTPLLKGIKARLWTCDPSSTGFYEETPFHPELLLEDLVSILHPEKNVTPNKRYFHQIP